MSSGKFVFLSWMRQGLATKIQSGQFTERATISADITVSNNQSAAVVSPVIQLLGPGDILGINNDAYVRFEPNDGVYDFDYTGLAYVDFYEEDFPWRYTPAKPNNNQLTPWLVLVVLKDNEFEFLPPEGEGLPLCLKIISTDLGGIFHPHNEHWNWAHIQVNKPSGANQSYIHNLKTDIKNNPDVAISRLLCTRRLEANTQYTAFLLPAFEVGRRAGLGDTNLAIDANTMAWSWVNNSCTVGLNGQPGHVNKFPVYKKWRFGTAGEGDFETLVRMIKPYTLLGSFAGRKMDITQTGMGVGSQLLYNQNPNLPKFVNIEGALKPPGVTLPINYPGTNYAPYTTELKKLLNLGADLRDSVNSNFPNPNPFVPGKNYYQSTAPTSNSADDPVILPPLYGQWHADQNKIESQNPPWFQGVNMDVRYRAVAGLGAEVVRKNQEYYMEVAWKQVGEIMVANDKMAKTRMALEASKSIFDKHLIGDLNKTSISAEEKLTTLTQIGSLGFIKFNTKNSGILGTSGNAPTLRVSATTAVKMSRMYRGSADSGFRKLTRNRSMPVQRVNNLNSNNTVPSSVNDRIVGKLNSDSVRVAGSRIGNPSRTYEIGILDHSVIRNEQLMPVYSDPYNYFLNESPGPDYTVIYRSAFKELESLLFEYSSRDSSLLLQESLGLVITPTQQQPENFVTDIIKGLDPEVNIKLREELQAKTTVNNMSQHPAIGKILAHPVLDMPMLEELVKISPEYLLPNIGEYPNNCVTLLEPNTQFIEAYMVGLNHEFSRELLWQEFPTDQRGTYFKRFWDFGDSVAGNPTDDITSIHTWGNSPLGANMTTGSTTLGSVGSNILILLIKADLLQKFSDPIIYAHKAINQTTLDPAGLLPGSIGVTRKYPLFKMSIEPNITMLAFNISKPAALGTVGNNNDPGWFFVFQERPGQLKFGLDQPPGVPLSSGQFDGKWNNLNWSNLFGGIYSKLITVNNGTIFTSIANYDALFNTNTNIQGPRWGVNSANTAAILYQKPVMVAVHARNMI